MRIQFATQSYRAQARQLSAQRCRNFYAEAQPRSAKAEVSVHGVPGIVDFANVGSGPIRGGNVMGGMAYVVSGNYLYSMSSAAVATQLGGQISGTGVVSMDNNGSELVITNGSNGYIYDTTSGFRLITDADFNAANTVSFINGRFAFDTAGTNEFQVSDVLAGTSYSDLFGSAETKADNVLAVHNLLQVLYVLCETHTELWADVGAANFPFQRIPQGVIDRGIAAPYAKAAEDMALFIYGNDRIAYRISGTTLSKVSTYALEQEWQTYSTVTDCFCFSYTFGGHKFIYFTFPSANITFGLDVATGLWHERSSRDIHGNDLGRWRGNCAFDAYGKTFIGDAFSPKVGYLSATTYTEFGAQILGELVSPPLHADGKLVSVPSFELDVETGTGLLSGDGENPQYMLDVSYDGGRIFDQAQVWQSAGRLGHNRTKLMWGPLGSTENEMVFRITCSDPVRRTIFGARVPELEVGL